MKRYAGMMCAVYYFQFISGQTLTLQAHGVPSAHWWLLGDYKGAVPSRIQWSRVCDLATHSIGRDLGVGMTSNTVWDDVSYVQRKGNMAAHAFEYMRVGRASADSYLFACVIRLVILHVHYAGSVSPISRF